MKVATMAAPLRIETAITNVVRANDKTHELQEQHGTRAHVTKSELARLAGEIGWYQEEARKTVMLALQYKLEIGRRLARAKSLLPHGKFLAWAQDEFGWTPRHIQRHLILAENAPRVSYLPPETSLRMALAAIRQLRSSENDEKTLQKAGTELPTQTLRIVGELDSTGIDQQFLLAEIERIAGELGVQKMRWRIR